MSKNSGEEFLIPLFFCYPNIELAKLYIKAGTETSLMSFLAAYLNYKNDLPYL